MKYLRHRNFTKRFGKLPRPIQTAFYERIELFATDYFHPLLDNHLLHGKYAGKRSINITGDYRAIFREENGIITFYVIGTHHELYGS